MDLVKIINDYVESSREEQDRRYIGASSIGHPCRRYIGYRTKSNELLEVSDKIDSKMAITFEIGKKLESMLLDYLEKANVNIEKPSKNNNQLELFDADIEQFRGHADGIIHFGTESCAILEIKTAKNSSFERFKSKGLLQWSETYYAQLQSYMGMSKAKQGVLLAINKDNSELHCEWVNFDNGYYLKLRDKAIAIYRSESEPEKVNQSPIYMLCNKCTFKGVCHGPVRT